MHQRPVLAQLYWLLVRVVVFLLITSFGAVVVLKYVPIWVTPLVVSRWIDTFGTDDRSHVDK